jgi:hypothetical protein
MCGGCQNIGLHCQQLPGSSYFGGIAQFYKGAPNIMLKKHENDQQINARNRQSYKPIAFEPDFQRRSQTLRIPRQTTKLSSGKNKKLNFELVL